MHHKHCDDSSSSGGGGGSSGGSSSGYYDGSGGDGSSAVNYDAANGDDAGRVSSTQTILDPSSMSFWLLLVALAAVVMAIIAMVMGQRKRDKPQHALTGSVARRMELFSTFADGALCGNEARPDRVVEMTASADDYEKAGASV